MKNFKTCMGIALTVTLSFTHAFGMKTTIQKSLATVQGAITTASTNLATAPGNPEIINILTTLNDAIKNATPTPKQVKINLSNNVASFGLTQDLEKVVQAFSTFLFVDVVTKSVHKSIEGPSSAVQDQFTNFLNAIGASSSLLEQVAQKASIENTAKAASTLTTLVTSEQATAQAVSTATKHIRLGKKLSPMDTSMIQQPEILNALTSADNDEKSAYIPKNFSWVSEEDGKMLAGMALPNSKKDIEFLDSKDIGLLVTLTKEKVLPTDWFKGTGVKNIRIPVKDFHTPTLDQADEFIQNVRQTHAMGKGVAVHCWGGIGRTGTMLATWFVAEKNMDADEAIGLIRKLRPHSIETTPQEQFVRDYDKHVHNG